jgi:hypothetical protein
MVKKNLRARLKEMQKLIDIAVYSHIYAIIRDTLNTLSTLTPPYLTFAPRSQMASMVSTMGYMNSALLSCRVRGMYKNLLRNDIDTVRFLANDTLHVIRTGNVYDRETVNRAVDHLYKILVNIAFKHYDNVSTNIRDIHYLVENEVIGNGSNIYYVDGVVVVNKY